MQKHSSIARINISRFILICIFLIMPTLSPHLSSRDAWAAPKRQSTEGGLVGPIIHDTVWGYDAASDQAYRESVALSKIPRSPGPVKYTPGTEPKGSSGTIANWIDPVAQTIDGQGSMPSPIASFPGLAFMDSIANWNYPPDTNGDVSPTHYIQTVNKSIALFQKDGARLAAKTLDNFFSGPNIFCDIYNYGDPVVVYDRFAERWVVSDFAFASTTSGPFYECLAISKTMTPTLEATDWYMYAIKISDTKLNDYPKLGVWEDGYYLTFNMYQPVGGSYEWAGVEIWGLNKTPMLSGGALQPVSFSLDAQTGYASLLPAHALTQPLNGTPAYFASVSIPARLQIWKFSADWVTPQNSTFTGPTEIPVADFAIAPSVPQKNTSQLLDSLSFRPMMQLIYREIAGTESLWLNHTVASNGFGAIRWYEIINPENSPTLKQQGTYQPDNNHRWMGSLAVDAEGNMAVGYSRSSSVEFPSIFYAGRLAGETLGILPQAEQALIIGVGSQTNSNRWGDYSHMSVDPSDDCTFWYTTEYIDTRVSLEWLTRIGSFKFPTCGQPKAYIQGTVRDANTLAPIPGVQVYAEGPSQTFNALSDESGVYRMVLVEDSYDITGGPLVPSYPISSTIFDVNASTGLTTTQNIFLAPAPYLVENAISMEDHPPDGNGNQHPEPGESNIELWEELENVGAEISSNIQAHLISLTPGVSVQSGDAAYPDIAAGEIGANLTPFVFSVDKNLPCGSQIMFQKVITDSFQTYTIDFSLPAAIPTLRAAIAYNDVESGLAGWTTGGVANTWAITTVDSHSPVHSWADSPAGNYPNNANSFVRSPVFDLSDKYDIRIGAWVKYSLEPGYDFVYLDYSLDGGSTWSTDQQALQSFNGYQDNWVAYQIDASVMDNQPNVAFRFRLSSDSGVTDDGIFIDDIELSYQPYLCTYGRSPIYLPILFTSP